MELGGGFFRSICGAPGAGRDKYGAGARLLYSLNPVVGVIDGFRWCLLGGESHLFLPGLGLSFCVTAFFLWLGLRQFRKMEKSFADLI